MRPSAAAPVIPLGSVPVTTGALRWLRGALVGVTATVLAASGHALAGGMVPGATQLGVIAAGSVSVGIALSGRRWTFPSLVTVLLGAQVVLHVAFSEGASMTGMHHDGSPWPMLLAHAVAAVVTALLLRRGEDWLWTFVESLLGPWHPLRLVVLPSPGRAPAPWAATASTRSSQWLASEVRRRGPPSCG